MKYGFPIFNREKSTSFIMKAQNAYISDIWAFWDYIIRMQKKKLPKGAKEEFLQALLEQAHYFYDAAVTAPQKSKPLLYYYSFMNLAKIIINVENYSGTTKKYTHGLECVWNDMTKINDAKIKWKAMIGSIDTISVAYQLMQAMDPGLTSMHTSWPWTCNISDLFASCLGIHRTFAEINNTKEKFYRLDSPMLRINGKTLSFSAYVHDCTPTCCRELNTRYTNISSEKDADGVPTGKFIWQESLLLKSSNPTQAELFQLSEILRKKGIWYSWDGEYSIMYISSQAILQTSEMIIYNLMFFLGSIARYQPYKFDELLSEKEHWLLSEFLETQPKQFLYLVTAKTIGRCVTRSRFVNL